MKYGDMIKLSLDSLFHRGLRSWLTILGIVIGIAAVVAMLSIGEGMEQSIEAQMSGLRADITTIIPGYTKAERHGGGFGGPPPGGMANMESESSKLTEDDISTINTVNGVDVVHGMVTGNADVSYLTENVTLSIKGVNPNVWTDITSNNLKSGRYLINSDSNKVVVGSIVANDVFEQSLSLNKNLEIEGKRFKIIGILEESGTGSFGRDDRTIFMTNDDARKILEDIESDEYSEIEVKVTGAERVDEIAGDIEEALYDSRHVTKDTQDFTVISPTATAETVTSSIETVELFIVAIAAISLLVGAIGIANTMFMSVMERTRLIGVLKSLGAKNSDIFKLFTIEAAIIGFIGGLIGVFVSLILVGIISGTGLSLGVPGNITLNAVVTPDLIIFALGFSTIIGIISGLIPAKRAANLQIIEALRSE